MVQFNYASFRRYPEFQQAYYFCQTPRALLSMAQNCFGQWTVKQLKRHRVEMHNATAWLPQYASRQQPHSHTRDLKMASKSLSIMLEKNK